jgi:helicase domain protein
MFKELDLKPVYTSNEDDLAKDFYTPVLENAITFDRTSAYFSAKALALYSGGLEYFGKKGRLYRLIISQEVSEEDYNQIKEGYSLRDSITLEMLQQLQDKLTITEEKQISNLAYFIALGVVEIKIAFRKAGIFHDKCGLATDENGDVICFRGSNNETEAAINSNYESFQVICSWLDANGFYSQGIKKSQDEFDDLWNNQKKDLIVLPAQDVIIKEILKHDKGKVVVEESLLLDNAYILDFDKQLLLHANVPDINVLLNKAFFKSRIRHKVQKIENNTLYFKSELTYTDFLKIDKIFSQKLSENNYRYLTTHRYRKYVEQKNIYIEKRASLGIELKTDASRLDERYIKFKKYVNQRMKRKLREQQMRDAFYMCAMTKSGNFSVPGSGKTSSAMAVYAYLKGNNLVNRIVMIGPKNAFGSWIDEFKLCFGNKEDLNVFNIQDRKFSSAHEKKRALELDSGNCNLFLFNYESLPAYFEQISSIVSTKTLLVFDEVHKVKAINGQRASYALKIAKDSSYTIAMTGTPIPNSYLDLYNLLHLLFNDEYNDFFGFDISYLRNPSLTDIEIINDKIQPFFCRTTKEELNVPAPNEDVCLPVHCSESEQRIFDIICQKYRSNKLALFIRILQLESNPKMLLENLNISDFSNVLEITDDIDNIDFVDYSREVKNLIETIEITTKKQKSIQLIKNLIDEHKRVVVWCIFKDTIRSLYNLLNSMGIKVRMIMGEVELEERNRLIDEFKSGKFDVLVTNPHTLAESVSLHRVCHDAIYFEYSYNLVHLLQSKDRIHRLGLPNNQYTQYYFLESCYSHGAQTYSLDEAVYVRLKEKEKAMLDAIDNHELEPVYTSEEDLNLIFNKF